MPVLKQKKNIKFITPAGYENLKQKLKAYEQRYEKVSAGKAEIAEQCGDAWHDNPTFEEAERLQKLYAEQIRTIKKQLKEAKIFKPTTAKRNRAGIGSKIKVKYPNGKTNVITITGSSESDPDRGLIAYDTPLGSCLMNKKQGQKARFSTGEQSIEIEIIEIKDIKA